MTSSYEQRIVDAMVRRSEALDRGDDLAAAEALVEAGKAASAMRHERRELGGHGEQRGPRSELRAVKS